MPLLTEDEIVVAKKRLAQAEDAYHDLLMGRGVASFEDQNGEKVSYNKADMGRLETYITGLKVDLGLITYGSSGPLEAFF